MVYSIRALRVDGISRSGKIEFICYTFPVEASYDPMYVVLLRLELIFKRSRLMDIGALGRCCGR